MTVVLTPTIIEATTIPDAWFQLVYQLVKGDVPRNEYTIDKGSYVGQKRWEFEFVFITIAQPGVRSLIPEIPHTLNIPPPVESMDYVDDYFTKYLMGTELEPNETYIYGTWLRPGVERVIEQLQGAPGNNQAAISIGGWAPGYLETHFFKEEEPNPSAPQTCLDSSPRKFCLDTDNFIDPGTGQRDPACLRVVDFRLDQKNTLHMFVYFRSWDLWGGLPANLAGLQLVKEYVATAIGAEDGSMVAASKGLHLYDYAIEVAAQRVGLENVGTLEELINHIGSGKG